MGDCGTPVAKAGDHDAYSSDRSSQLCVDVPLNSRLVELVQPPGLDHRGNPRTMMDSLEGSSCGVEVAMFSVGDHDVYSSGRLRQLGVDVAFRPWLGALGQPPGEYHHGNPE